MHVGYQVLSWRRSQGWTQSVLAARSGVTRPYLSRLEKGSVDPALSTLRRLALALGIPVGKLLDELPAPKVLSRDELDGLARAALHPGAPWSSHPSEARVLARLVKQRRKALGLYHPRHRGSSPGPKSTGIHAGRWLRARLGETQWKALLRRIDKLASQAHPLR